MADRKYFTVESTSLTIRKSGSLAIYCGDRPRRNADGSTSHSLRAPMAIIPPELFDDEEERAETLAEVLNENAHRFYKSACRSTATMTPQQLLEVYDKFMSAEPITDAEKEITERTALAAIFGAEAYEKGIDANQGTHAMLRSVLLALIDPLHPDLDYLRADPASGALERAKREEVTNGKA